MTNDDNVKNEKLQYITNKKAAKNQDYHQVKLIK